MMYNVKRVIMTGATGAVGIPLIYELINNEVEVTVICRSESKRVVNIPQHPNVKIVEGDLKNLRSLKNTLLDKYDVFYHLGWDGTYGEARQNLQLQLKNVQYALDAVELANCLECHTFIGVGSQGECGTTDGLISSSTACNPNTGYGSGKLAALHFTRIACEKNNMKHVWCRIVSLFGCFDGEHTMVMSSLKGMLNGQVMSFTKGEQVWDYLYNKDAALALRLLAEKGKHRSIYCLGSGNTRKLSDYITVMRDLINPELKIKIGEVKYYSNQAMYLKADITNLIQDTGFKPQYSFEQGIQETIQWIKERCKDEY